MLHDTGCWAIFFNLDSTDVDVKTLVCRPSKYCNVSSWRNTLIKLTPYDEIKKGLTTDR